MKFMSGRALFTYNPDLFQDADGDDNEETKDEFEEVKEDNDEDFEESKEDGVKVD
jgi:ABC-type glycerol-3-phosphate transport system substrate-binding protein